MSVVVYFCVFSGSLLSAGKRTRTESEKLSSCDVA